MRLVILISGFIICFSCSTEPEPIAFGQDQCAYCKMTIADPNYGGEIITKKGRIYKFDATECLINYFNENEVTVSQKLVIPFDDPKHLHLVDSVHFVIDEKYRSPMGKNLAAFKDKSNAEITNPQFMTWNELTDKWGNRK